MQTNVYREVLGFRLEPLCIYFDSQEAVLSESGDILLPLEGASLPKTILPVISEMSSTES